ncbi:MerR family transcriptional regulator [Lacticaseibacillus saniviri]
MTITELAATLDVTTATLRYYEGIGLVTSDRQANGNRHYTEQQIDRAKRIVYFRRAGVSISELQQLFSNEMSDETALKLLQAAKAKIERQQEQLNETLAFLNYKTQWHEAHRKTAQSTEPTR